MKKILLSTIFFAAFYCFANAQVHFNIEWVESEQAYQVSLISEATWVNPSNITSTGQVSLKAPTGTLDVYNLKNLQNDVVWEFSSKYDAPQEAPGFDYLSFGLASMGTFGIKYEAGVEVPLFSFQNAMDCQGAVVEILDNDADSFMPPNSQKANVGNQLTVLGAGGNAYTGISGTGKTSCNSFVSSTTSGLPADKAGLALQTSFEVFPTKVQSEVHLRFDWTEQAQDVEIRIYESNGKLQRTQNATVLAGLNQITLTTDQLASGLYFIEVEADGMTRNAGRFMRM